MPTYPLELPALLVPSVERLRLVRVQAAATSIFTGATQTVDNYAQWAAQISFPRKRFAEAEEIAAFLDSLRGRRGTFRYPPRQSVASSLTGKTLAAGLFAYGNVALVGGWTASQASGLRLGQFIQIGAQLLRITAAPSTASGSGQCQIEFEPYVRSDFATGTAVTFASPKGLFRLTTGDQTGFAVDPSKLPEFGPIEIEEAIEVTA